VSRGAATPIAVSWDRVRRVPRSFLWRGCRYRVDDVRVAAEGRVFDLCYDRLRKGWFLERALN
jgi:hypothetical protein